MPAVPPTLPSEREHFERHLIVACASANPRTNAGSSSSCFPKDHVARLLASNSTEFKSPATPARPSPPPNPRCARTVGAHRSARSARRRGPAVKPAPPIIRTAARSAPGRRAGRNRGAWPCRRRAATVAFCARRTGRLRRRQARWRTRGGARWSTLPASAAGTSRFTQSRPARNPPIASILPADARRRAWRCFWPASPRRRTLRGWPEPAATSSARRRSRATPLVPVVGAAISSTSPPFPQAVHRSITRPALASACAPPDARASPTAQVLRGVRLPST